MRLLFIALLCALSYAQTEQWDAVVSSSTYYELPHKSLCPLWDAVIKTPEDCLSAYLELFPGQTWFTTIQLNYDRTDFPRGCSMKNANNGKHKPTWNALDGENFGTLKNNQRPVCKFTDNHIELQDNTGVMHGGACTCPDGTVFQVSDNNDNCNSGLACIGGSHGTCNLSSGEWSEKRVICAVHVGELCEEKPTIDVDFESATVITSNLGGNAEAAGDAASGTADEIYYQGVAELNGQRVNLRIVTTTPDDYECNNCNSVKAGVLGKINMAKSTSIDVTFSFVFDDDQPATLAILYMTFVDIDGAFAATEIIELNGLDEYYITSDTLLDITTSGQTVIASNQAGNIDNPSNLDGMTDEQQRVALVGKWANVDSFTATLTTGAGDGGRNILFGGISDLLHLCGTTQAPTNQPSGTPTSNPSTTTNSPTHEPIEPTKNPSNTPSAMPSKNPSNMPTFEPTKTPSSNPSKMPTTEPSTTPSKNPSSMPSSEPSTNPSTNPSFNPSSMPTSEPSTNPSTNPSFNPSNMPTSKPSTNPSTNPSNMPTNVPTFTTNPTSNPTTNPSSSPSQNPSKEPTSNPSSNPSNMPTGMPTKEPSSNPSTNPTSSPSQNPSKEPTSNPSSNPSNMPTAMPTKVPTTNPSANPSSSPSKNPSSNPSNMPTAMPTKEPSANPSANPSSSPSQNPSSNPSNMPTAMPTKEPSTNPSANPSSSPSKNPSSNPTNMPTAMPTKEPSANPSANPTTNPSSSPSKNPSSNPSNMPSTMPTKVPSTNPTVNPTQEPTATSHGDPIIWTFNDDCYDLNIDGLYLASSHKKFNHDVKVAVYNDYMREIQIVQRDSGKLLLSISNLGEVVNNWPYHYSHQKRTCPPGMQDCIFETDEFEFDAQDFHFTIQVMLHDYLDPALQNGETGVHLDIHPRPYPQRPFRKEEYKGIYFENPLPEVLNFCPTGSSRQPW